MRQLYEPALHRTKTSERRTLLSGAAARTAALVGLEEREVEGIPSPDSRFELNHGLYWLTANMAERAPLVLLIDDAHWSDSASLLFLHFLAARIEELSLLAVLSLRPAQAGSQHELLQHLSDLPASGAAQKLERAGGHARDWFDSRKSRMPGLVESKAGRPGSSLRS